MELLGEFYKKRNEQRKFVAKREEDEARQREKFHQTCVEHHKEDMKNKERFLKKAMANAKKRLKKEEEDAMKSEERNKKIQKRIESGIAAQSMSDYDSSKESNATTTQTDE